MYTTFEVTTESSNLGLYQSTCKRACDTCRRFKIKCESLQPSTSYLSKPKSPCDQCRRTKTRCTYNERPGKRGRRRREDQRLSREETLLGWDFAEERNPEASRLDQAAVQRQVASEWNDSDTISTSPPPQGHFYSGLERDSTADDARLANDMLPIIHDFAPNASIISTMDETFPRPETQSEVDIWRSVHQFFDTLYIIFPIVSYADVTSRLIQTPDWFSVPDLRTLLLSLRLLNAAGQYRMDSKNETVLRYLVRQVETSRMDHDFADPATLDSVVCSLSLFTAYNVLEMHGRAYLYLEEAAYLFEAVSPSTDAEKLRKLRIQQVLFNTEAATTKIYRDRNRQPRVPRPTLNINDASVTESGVRNTFDSIGVATHLLTRLTEIHLAEDADALEKINLESESDVKILFGNVLRQHRYSRIQAADVVLTRQWQLSSKLVAARSRGLSVERPSRSAIELLGLLAMSWVCVLREGELRVVGLGKLAGLAHNIYRLTGPMQCRSVLGGLAGAVSKEDHDRRYAPSLAKILLPTMTSIPSTLSVQNDSGTFQTLARANSETLTDLEAFEPNWQFQSLAEVELEDEVMDDRGALDFDRFIDLC